MVMFGTKTKLHKSVISPLEQGDHPELDTSELLDDEDTHKYQSLVGSLHWDISLDIFDIFTHAITMSSFGYVPCQGHV